MPPDEPPDKRSAPRQQSADLVVRYSSATVDKFIEEHAHDVSKGGMFVRSAAPLNPGTLVDFEIRLANDQPVVTGVGRVVWKREKAQGARPAGMGVKFIDLDESSSEVIDRLLGAVKPGARSEFDMKPAGNLGTNVKTVMGMGSPFGLVPGDKPSPRVQPAREPPPEPEPAPEPAPAQPASPLASADLSRGRTRMGVAPVKLSAEDAARVASRLGLPSPQPGATLVLGEQSGPRFAAAAQPQPTGQPQPTRPIQEPPAQWKGPTAAAAKAPESARTGEIDEGWGEPETHAAAVEPALAATVAAGSPEPAPHGREQPMSEPPVPTPRVQVPDMMPGFAAARGEPAGSGAAPGAGAPPAEQSRDQRSPSTRPQARSEPPLPLLRDAAASESEPSVRIPKGPLVWPWVLLLVILGGVVVAYRYRAPLHDRGLLPALPELPWNIPWLNPAPPPPVAPPPPPSASASAEAPASASASAEPPASASAAPPSSATAQPDAAAAETGRSGSAAGHKPSAAASGSAAPRASASAKPHPKPAPKPPPDTDEAAE